MVAITRRQSPALLVLPNDVRLMNTVSALLVAVLVFGAAAFGLRTLLHSPRFAIAGIVVEGDVTRNTVATIRASTMPKLEGNFFSIDLRAARAVFESVPWVRHAVVRRVWPDRLAVTFEEHRPAAFWRGSDGIEKLVNDHGEVFQAKLGSGDDDVVMSLLVGPDDSSAQMLEMLTRLVPLVKPLDAGIDKLELSGRGSWSLVLDNKTEIQIGRGTDEEVAARLERFVRSLPNVATHVDREVVHADLRHRDGFAVRLKDVITTPDAPMDKPAPKKPNAATKPRGIRN